MILTFSLRSDLWDVEVSMLLKKVLLPKGFHFFSADTQVKHMRFKIIFGSNLCDSNIAIQVMFMQYIYNIVIINSHYLLINVKFPDFIFEILKIFEVQIHVSNRVTDCSSNIENRKNDCRLKLARWLFGLKHLTWIFCNVNFHLI